MENPSSAAGAEAESEAANTVTAAPETPVTTNEHSTPTMATKTPVTAAHGFSSETHEAPAPAIRKSPGFPSGGFTSEAPSTHSVTPRRPTGFNTMESAPQAQPEEKKSYMQIMKEKAQFQSQQFESTEQSVATQTKPAVKPAPKPMAKPAAAGGPVMKPAGMKPAIKPPIQKPAGMAPPVPPQPVPEATAPETDAPVEPGVPVADASALPELDALPDLPPVSELASEAPVPEAPAPPEMGTAPPEESTQVEMPEAPAPVAPVMPKPVGMIKPPVKPSGTGPVMKPIMKPMAKPGAPVIKPAGIKPPVKPVMKPGGMKPPVMKPAGMAPPAPVAPEVPEATPEAEQSSSFQSASTPAPDAPKRGGFSSLEETSAPQPEEKKTYMQKMKEAQQYQSQQFAETTHAVEPEIKPAVAPSLPAAKSKLDLLKDSLNQFLMQLAWPQEKKDALMQELMNLPEAEQIVFLEQLGVEVPAPAPVAPAPAIPAPPIHAPAPPVPTMPRPGPGAPPIRAPPMAPPIGMKPPISPPVSVPAKPMVSPPVAGPIKPPVKPAGIKPPVKPPVAMQGAPVMKPVKPVVKPSAAAAGLFASIDQQIEQTVSGEFDVDDFLKGLDEKPAVAAPVPQIPRLAPPASPVVDEQEGVSVLKPAIRLSQISTKVEKKSEEELKKEAERLKAQAASDSSLVYLRLLGFEKAASVGKAYKIADFCKMLKDLDHQAVIDFIKAVDNDMLISFDDDKQQVIVSELSGPELEIMNRQFEKWLRFGRL